MLILNNERINEKLIYLNELLFDLQEISKIEKKDFYKSKIYFNAAENCLRKALQTVIDFAEDLVSKNRLRTLLILL